MKAPNREEIVKEALKEINPAADKKAACEKEIRNYLSILDVVHADLGGLPTPKEMRERFKQDAAALRKVERIVGRSPKGRFADLVRGGLELLFRRLIVSAAWTSCGG
jgi:hypothetical protein